MSYRFKNHKLTYLIVTDDAHSDKSHLQLPTENQSGLKDTVAQGYLNGLKTGSIITGNELETALYNISGLGGVQAAGVLSPGSEVGTSDVTVKVAKGKKNVLIVYAENYGSTSSGRYRYSNTEGAYTKGVLNFKYVQGFDNRWDLLVKGQGQLASRNLDSSEDIYLGGPNAIRAYPQGEASGDQGYVATAELRYKTGVPGLVLSTYFDTGRVQLSKDGSSGSEILKGYGFAISYTRPDDWFVRFDYARRIGGDDNMSTAAQDKGRMWFLLGKVF